MKKLMLTAAAAAMATGAYAVDPTVYSYRASVTHMYVRLVSVNQSAAFWYPSAARNVPAGRVQVYQKFKKTASLSGFLVQDTQGVTSRNIQNARVRNWQDTPIYDQGRNRSFLIVQNSSVEANVRRPKIMPAVLEAKWYDTRFANRDVGGFPTAQETAGTAQGLLYVGGELLFSANGAGIRAKLDNGGDLPFNEHANSLINAGGQSRTPVSFADHLWTSCYLFGQYNGPQWSGYYQNLETQINLAQPNYLALPANVGPAGNQRAAFSRQAPLYHDTWMNHAGIGTYTLTDVVNGEICCGLSLADTPAAKRLASLSGNMKGGVYICSDNGYIQASGVYEPFIGVLWEDQFWSFEANPGNRNMFTFVAADNYNVAGPASAFGANADAHQSDVWTDGNIAQTTTDVLYGTWSIQRTTNYRKEAITFGERNLLAAATYGRNTVAPETEWTTVPGAEGTAAAPLTTGGYDDANDLLEVIKGCAVSLNNNTTFMVRENAFQSREIYDYTSAERFDIPFLTTRFARAYGLAVYR